MPSIQDAIKIAVSMEATPPAHAKWGVVAIIGEKGYVTNPGVGEEPDVVTYGGSSTATEPIRITPTTNIISLFGSPDTNEGTEYTGSKLTRALMNLFAQGVSEAYVLPVIADVPGAPTKTEFETAIANFASLAIDKKISGCIYAGITANETIGGVPSVEILKTLKAFCIEESHNLIYAFTNKPDANTYKLETGTKTTFYNETPGSLGFVNELGSANGIFIANADDEIAEDIAAVGMGVVMCQQPWSTIMWKNVVTNTSKYFLSSKLGDLENDCRGNAIIRVGSTNVLSNGLTTEIDPYKYIDITRTKNYVVLELKNALIDLRRRTPKIPFTQPGLSLVGATLTSTMSNAVDIGALSEFRVTLPTYRECTDEDKTNRVLKGVKITGKIAGDIHEFNVELAITV